MWLIDRLFYRNKTDERAEESVQDGSESPEGTPASQSCADEACGLRSICPSEQILEGACKQEITYYDDEELDAFAAGKLRMAVQDGDDKQGCFLAGQSAGLVKKEESCEEILKDLMADCEKQLRRLEEWVK